VKPLPTFKIAHRVIRLSSGADGTTWPWPFRADDSHSAAWKARYAPNQLTQTDLYELASIADAYETLISHPSRSLRETMHVLHRVFDSVCRHGVLDEQPCAECEATP
jgi:hypothetical protein